MTTLAHRIMRILDGDRSAMFARGGGGAKSSSKGGKGKGKAGKEKSKKGKGVAQSGSGGACCKAEGGKFAPGNNYGSLNRGSAKVAANKAGRTAAKAVAKAAGPARAGIAGMIGRSRQAAAKGGQQKAARDREQAVAAQKQARNAKARERRAAKKGAAQRKPGMERMVARSKGAAAKGASSVSAKVRAEAKAAGYGPAVPRQLGLAAGARAKTGAEGGRKAAIGRMVARSKAAGLASAVAVQQKKSDAMRAERSAAIRAKDEANRARRAAHQGTQPDRIGRVLAKAEKISDREYKSYRKIEDRLSEVNTRLRSLGPKAQKTFEKLSTEKAALESAMSGRKMYRSSSRVDRLRKLQATLPTKSPSSASDRAAALKRITNRSKAAVGKAAAGKAGRTTAGNVAARIAAAKAAQKAQVGRTAGGTGKASDADRAALAQVRAENAARRAAAKKPVDTRSQAERWRAAGIQPHSLGTGKGTFKPAGAMPKPSSSKADRAAALRRMTDRSRAAAGRAGAAKAAKRVEAGKALRNQMSALSHGDRQQLKAKIAEAALKAEHARVAAMQPTSLPVSHPKPKPYGDKKPPRQISASAAARAEAIKAARTPATPTKGIGGREPDLRGVAPAGKTPAASRAIAGRATAISAMVRKSREAAQGARMVANKRAAAATKASREKTPSTAADRAGLMRTMTGKAQDAAQAQRWKVPKGVTNVRSLPQAEAALAAAKHRVENTRQTKIANQARTLAETNLARAESHLARLKARKKRAIS